MKVLVINTSPAFHDGITNVIVNINHAIEKKNLKMDILVVAKPNDSFIKKMENENSTVYYLPRSIRGIVKYMVALYKIIKNNSYDIVHIHGNSHTTVIELLCAFVAGCGVRIVHAHNTFCLEKIIHIISTPLFDLLCTNRFACGEAAGIFMYGNHHFDVIKNGIDTNRFKFSITDRNKMRSEFGLEEKFVIGHVGTLNNAHKNQEFLIDILNELLKKDTKYHLCLIGDGQDKKNLQNKIISYGIDNAVTFVGAVDDSAPYLSMFDLIVMPSIYEGLPISLIEEQANGLTCIVSDSISNEVDITGNVIFLSLNEGSKKWASIINEFSSVFKTREDISMKSILSIVKCGYDIHEEANCVLNKYQEATK